MKQKSTFPFFSILFLLALLPFSASSQCTNDELATSYASNNGSRGCMFNIVSGASPVTITGFSANLYGGTTAKYEIYYKEGTYAGFETNAASWTLVGSVNSLYAAANNVPTRIPIPMSITMPANSTFAFYVTNTASGGLNYTSSAVTNVTLATNSALSIVGGVGKAYPFSSTYSYRLFNGTVHYYTGTITSSNTLATSNASSPVISQNASGSSVYGADCNALIATVTGSGANPINGNSTAKVWVEGTQPASYVKRHYEITPASNAASATGTVTLYFTQQEFTDYNALNIIKLPADAADLDNNKLNLRIEKRSGTSSNGSGLPESYTGAVQVITPASVTWNATSSRWEVVLNVTGFSGFFAKTGSFMLPLNLLSFSVSDLAAGRQFNWETSGEINTKEFVLEFSRDGQRYTKLVALPAAGSGDHHYQYTDKNAGAGKLFYRIKMTDQDESYRYSKVISLGTDLAGKALVYPNPAVGEVSVYTGKNGTFNRLRLFDLNGRLVLQKQITGPQMNLDVSGLPEGVYMLQLGTAEKAEMQVEKLVIRH